MSTQLEKDKHALKDHQYIFIVCVLTKGRDGLEVPWQAQALVAAADEGFGGKHLLDLVGGVVFHRLEPLLGIFLFSQELVV